MAALAGLPLADSLAGTDGEKDLFSKRFAFVDALARYTRLDGLAQPLLMAHRAGYSPQGGFPECVIQSADNVVHTGPAMIGIDIRTAADGKLVCMHDKILDRTTTGSGLVKEAEAKLVAQLFLRDALGAVTGYRVPRLDSFPDWSTNVAPLSASGRRNPPASF